MTQDKRPRPSGQLLAAVTTCRPRARCPTAVERAGVGRTAVWVLGVLPRPHPYRSCWTFRGSPHPILGSSVCLRPATMGRWGPNLSLPHAARPARAPRPGLVWVAGGALRTALLTLPAQLPWGLEGAGRGGGGNVGQRSLWGWTPAAQETGGSQPPSSAPRSRKEGPCVSQPETPCPLRWPPA